MYKTVVKNERNLSCLVRYLIKLIIYKLNIKLFLFDFLYSRYSLVQENNEQNEQNHNNGAGPSSNNFFNIFASNSSSIPGTYPNNQQNQNNGQQNHQDG